MPAVIELVRVKETTDHVVGAADSHGICGENESCWDHPVRGSPSVVCALCGCQGKFLVDFQVRERCRHPGPRRVEDG
eukprot:822143-Pyramimonas_sp.AAC.1